jgi:hypothetical protein
MKLVKSERVLKGFLSPGSVVVAAVDILCNFNQLFSELDPQLTTIEENDSAGQTEEQHELGIGDIHQIHFRLTCHFISIAKIGNNTYIEYKIRDNYPDS